MNIKLTLLLVALTINSINAETIRERLQRKKAIADEQIKHEAKTLETLRSKIFVDTAVSLVFRRDNIEKDKKKEIKQEFKTYSLALRSDFLETMINCINQHQSANEIVKANDCYSKLAEYLEKPEEFPNEKQIIGIYYSDREKKELAQKEYERIGDKDLRCSWLWWLY